MEDIDTSQQAILSHILAASQSEKGLVQISYSWRFGAGHLTVLSVSSLRKGKLEMQDNWLHHFSLWMVSQEVDLWITTSLHGQGKVLCGSNLLKIDTKQMLMWSSHDFSSQDGWWSRTQIVAFMNLRILSTFITVTGLKYSLNTQDIVFILLTALSYNQTSGLVCPFTILPAKTTIFPANIL